MAKVIIPFYCNNQSLELLNEILKKYDKSYIRLIYFYNFYFDVYNYTFFFYRFCKKYVKKEIGLKIKRLNVGKDYKVNLRGKIFYSYKFLKNKFLKLLYLINKNKIKIIETRPIEYNYYYLLKIPKEIWLKMDKFKNYYDCFDYEAKDDKLDIIPIINNKITIKNVYKFYYKNYIYLIPRKFE